MPKLKFPCTACGHCCRNIGATITAAKEGRVLDKHYSNEILNFPYVPKEDGSCPMLAKDGTCNTYEDRPLICNMDKLADTYTEGSEGRLNFFIENARVCNKLMDAHGNGEKLDLKKLEDNEGN